MRNINHTQTHNIPVAPRLADVKADDTLENPGGPHDGVVRICQEGVYDVLPWEAGALLEPYLGFRTER